MVRSSVALRCLTILALTSRGTASPGDGNGTCAARLEAWPSGNVSNLLNTTPSLQWVELRDWASGCSDPWVTEPGVGDRCFLFSGDRANFTAAAGACRSFSAELVTIRDSGAQEFLARRLEEEGSDHWIGANISGAGVRWYGGGLSSYTKWQGGEQPTVQTPQCVRVSAVRPGYWTASDCENVIHYVCAKASGGVRHWGATSWVPNEDDGHVVHCPTNSACNALELARLRSGCVYWY